MQDYQKTMVKSLVAVAWADGKMRSEETEVIEAVLSAFEASEAEAAEIRDYARTPKTLDDVPITDLSESDRDALLQHAVIITFIDGSQEDSEKTFLVDLANRLGMPADRRDALLSQATARARRLLS